MSINVQFQQNAIDIIIDLLDQDTTRVIVESLDLPPTKEHVQIFHVVSDRNGGEICMLILKSRIKKQSSLHFYIKCIEQKWEQQILIKLFTAIIVKLQTEQSLTTSEIKYFLAQFK